MPASAPRRPGVFRASGVGPWIAPDDATTTGGLVAVAEACPSGAIQSSRHDGGPEEASLLVNLVQPWEKPDECRMDPRDRRCTTSRDGRCAVTVAAIVTFRLEG
jgi:hypothetical protein